MPRLPSLSGSALTIYFSHNYKPLNPPFSAFAPLSAHRVSLLTMATLLHSVGNLLPYYLLSYSALLGMELYQV